MKTHWINCSVSVAAIALLLAASPDAQASKEKFVRDKPHVTIDAEEKKDEKKDVADKTNKDESARSKKRGKGKAKREAKKRAKEVVENRDDGSDPP